MDGDSARREFDVIVIGAGYAGLSAALWLGRYRRRTLILNGGPPRNQPTRSLHGYLGFDGQSPSELLAAGERDIASYPTVSIESARAAAIRSDGSGFLVSSGSATTYAHRVILATGVSDELPAVQGIEEHLGVDVFNCPSCDGYEAKGKRVVVLGSSADVMAFATSLLDWAADVTVVTAGQRFEGGAENRAALARRGIAVIEDDAVAFVGRPGALTRLRVANQGEIVCELAFFSLGKHALSGLATEVGCRVTSDGYLDADADGRTSVPGVYAAGDVAGGPQLVQIATASGTRAGVACARSFHGDVTSPLSANPAPKPPA